MGESTEGNGSVQAQEQVLQRGASPEAFARSQPEPPPQAPRKPFYKRPLVLLIGGILIVGGIVVGVLWWLHARHFVSTDDAFIEADVTQVSPRVAGHVQTVNATDNLLVQKDSVLVTLDPRDLEARYSQSNAAVQAAQSNLQTAQDNAATTEADMGSAQAAQQAAQTEANRAQEELARYEKLSPAAVTQQQLINLRAAARSAQAQLEAARQKTAAAQAHVNWARSQIAVAAAQLTQAKAALKEAQLQLSYTQIKAPITGYVTNRSVNVGDYVQVGQALLALVPQSVYVIANFKETQLDRMQPGQEVDLTVDAYPGHVFHGRVDTLQRGSGSAFSLLPPENATGNYVKVVQRVPVKITFDSQGYRLGPGMSVVPKVKVR